ncbi:MAG: barstar family protein [Oscillospiraceae bacterium]|jgi:hypothetical protein|nr:barstar family protein [Oscillospiraceae bacterium]
MQNKIHHVNALEAAEIAQKTRDSGNLHLVEIQGKKIQSWEDFYQKMEEGFRFPTISVNYNAYLDWIEDLDWLGKDGYVLIIHDYKNFLEQDLLLKDRIMEGFADMILPWWQGDDEDSVVHCVVGGEAKPFNVYLVD